MANCPVCGKGYQISYQVGEIKHEPTWDVDIEAQKKAETESREQRRIEKIEELENELNKLRGRGGYR